jgi:hypothetical protein
MGLTPTATCDPLGTTAVKGLTPAAGRFRNMRVKIDAPAAAEIDFFALVPGSIQFGCTIPAGQRLCEDTGVSGVFPAAAEFWLEADYNGADPVPPMSFGYEIVPPSGVIP